MKTIALLGFLLTVSLAAVAQVEPAATGPSRPSGTFIYSLRDSQIAWWSSYLGDQQANAVSGSLQYESGKARSPLAVNYGGGYTFILTGSNFGSGYFQNFTASKGFSGRKWRLRINDGIAYQPQSPTFGFPGVPGTGEPIAPPPPTGPPNETVLTENTHAINNVTSASFRFPINFALSFSADGSLGILRYPDGNGYGSTAYAGSGGLSYRLNNRTSITGSFVESKYTYAGSISTFETTGVVGSINHTFSKGFTGLFSIGPDFVSSQNTQNFPASTNLFLSAGMNYHKRFDSFGVTYYHGDNSGSGVFYGATYNSLGANYSRTIEKQTTVSATFGYQENSGLVVGSGSSSGIFAGVSAARRLGKLFSIATSYTATEQTASSQLPTNVLNGLLQGVSVSFGYSPRGIKGIEK